MSRNEKSFRVYETTLSFSGEMESQPGPKDVDYHRGPWTTYLKMLKSLRGWGWILTDSPRIRHQFRSFAQTHHAGAKGILRFEGHIAPGATSLEFYEDVARDNSYGGKYTSRKLQSMSYLDRLRVIHILNRLKGLLLEAGYVDESEKPTPQGGLAYRDHMWARWGPGREDVYLKPGPYNSTDRDKKVMQNGDFRYFRDYKGRIGKGQVWNDGNSMWVVLPNEASGTRLSSFDFFNSFNAGQDPSRLPRHPRQKVAEALNRAISTRDFGRAQKIQDYIDRTYNPGRPKVGDTVRIDSSRYHGVSKVEEASALGVSCNLGSGLRWFEYATVEVVR
jgi:hypothetical protein